MTRQKNAIFLLGVLLDASPFQVFSLFLKNGLNMFENKKEPFLVPTVWTIIDSTELLCFSKPKRSWKFTSHSRGELVAGVDK